MSTSAFVLMAVSQGAIVILFCYCIVRVMTAPAAVDEED